MFQQYLKKYKFEKYFKRLKNHLKGKKIVLYGAGSFFSYIFERFSFEQLDVVGICDAKFTQDDIGKKYCGYDVLLKENLESVDCDCILITAQNYLLIMEELYLDFCKNQKIKIYPLLKLSFVEELTKIWGF